MNEPISMRLDRRRFLKLAGGAVLLAHCPQGLRGATAPDAGPGRAPFRLLYNNDTTNTVTCISPWHKKGEPFRAAMLEASVDEVAGLGVDAHLLAPGLSWVPWWKSKLYPAEDHFAWFKETYGKGPDSYGQFLLDGGDYVQVFLDRCRLRGQAPFLSFRLNDGHHKEWVDAKPGDKINDGALQGVTRFYKDHPEYRIGADLLDWSQRVHNWAIPEVRAHKFAFIQELCENYDFEGLELDFMRYFSYFQLDKTTGDERRAVMTGFIGQVRQLLDRTARNGQRRWLCVRVPGFTAAWDGMGIDLPAMVAAGVDMANLSSNYFTADETDLPAIRRLVPQAAVYNEMAHVTWNGKPLGKGYDSHKDRRTTPEQFQTAAHHAYARGADGMCLFNFAYYREYGDAYRGPFSEPPFSVLPHLRDKEWLARQPQHYFLSRTWKNPFFKFPLSRVVKPGQAVAFSIDLAPPTGGWNGTGGFRLQGDKDLGESQWRVKLNGTELKPREDRSEPYPNPYTQLLGQPEELRAWHVPAEVLRDGPNAIEITLQAGDAPLELAFLDLWMAGTPNAQAA